MPRPQKCRRVCCCPKLNLYKPEAIPIHKLDIINLTLDELEAIRLADLEGCYQEKAAKQMNISRQTFGNIIISAHKKIAECLVNGKGLKIEGGEVEMNTRQFLCCECKHEWSLPFGTGRPGKCPSCQCKNIHRSPKDRGCSGHRGRGHKHENCR